jgi:DNA polymerase-3 subunit epsilon
VSGVREIVFDTETTGFDAKGDDRITEIGCIEIIDLLPTGESFHAYVDPQRDISEKVTEITGLTREFLDGKPLFKDVAQDFLDFVGDSSLIAHNADFDRGFINAELERNGFPAWRALNFPVPPRRLMLCVSALIFRWQAGINMGRSLTQSF